MESYEALAASYDELTEDVAYEKRADFVEKLFLRAKRPVKSLLDLACGTGTMSALFARRGHGRRLVARNALPGAAKARRVRSAAAAFVPVDAAAESSRTRRRRHLLP